jgi:hypothetical protein
MESGVNPSRRAKTHCPSGANPFLLECNPRYNSSEAKIENQWIEVNPKGVMGKPVSRGTQVPVDWVLQKTAAGELEFAE